MAKDYMMKRYLLVLIGAAALVMTATVHAHHPMREYRDDRIETVEGMLVRFEVSNPHSIVYIEPRNEQSPGGLWRIEWVSGLQLKRQGVLDRTLKPGDRLIITGHPSYDPAEHRLKLRTVVRPSDGWKWTGTFE
jgi:Family of unknown function (DUF6152)